MRNKGVRRENVLWMDCEGQGRAKRMNGGEPVRALRRMCALMSLSFICAFILFSAIPVSAHSNIHKAESTHQFTLQIYGNANEDDTIDMRDVTYIKLVIFGKKPETALCDANYDGRVSMLDVVQTKLIIVGKEGEITIVDSANRIVTVKEPVKRIIPLSDHHADVIRVLEAENNVVGVTTGIAREKTLLPEMSKMPTVGSGWKPDIEKIIELQPDIVIHYVTWAPELEEKLEPAGISVIRLNFTMPEEIPEEVIKLGYVLNKRSRAEEFVDWYNSYMNIIKSRTKELPEEERPRVYIELYPDIWENKAFGGGSSGDRQCEIAGGINIARELPSTAEVDPEWIIRQDPEIIIQVVTSKAPSGYGVDDITGVKAVREKEMSRPEFQNITAIRNGNVYVMASDIRCGIQGIICIAYWAKWFHPDLFTDLDPQAIHQEYVNRFQRIDYDIKEHGVFVYPPLES